MAKKYIPNEKEKYMCEKHKVFFKKKLLEWKDEIIIFKDCNTDKLKIYSSICPHFGGEIIFDSKKNILRCKWHGWKFCIDSGKCLSYPIKGKINPYNFEIKPNPLNKYDFLLEDKEIYAIKKKENE